MNWLARLSLLVTLLTSTAGYAAIEQSANDMDEIVRQRLYPGGVDEEDLKVLDQLPPVIQKVSKKEVQKNVYKDLFKTEEEEKPSSSD